MCVTILRSIGTKLTKLEHMQKSRFIWFIWLHVTQKRYVMRHGDCDTSCFGDLDLDLWPIFYCLSHALRMMYWNIHAKFH